MAVDGRPTFVDLFSGAGGFSLGFHAAGYRLIAAVDFDEVAAGTLDLNFRALEPDAPPRVVTGDEGNLEELDFDRILPRGERLDVLLGSPPCQGFSWIGRAKLDSLSEEGFASDPRNDLYSRFVEAAEWWRPRVVVMENVTGMQSVDGINFADRAAGDLARRGYRVGWTVLNAVWYGVPQYRDRFFMLGIRDDVGVDPSLPPATHAAELPPGYLRPTEGLNLALPFVEYWELRVDLSAAQLPAVTVAEALDDLPCLVDHFDCTSARAGDPQGVAREYSCPPGSTYAQLMRSWPGLGPCLTVSDHEIRKTPRDFETFRRMQPGDRYPEAITIARQRLQEALESLESTGQRPAEDSAAFKALQHSIVPPYPEDIFASKWRKLIPSQPSWTVPAHLAKDAYSHIHYDSRQARAISVREAARLQSFPDAYRLTGSMGDRFRQIGNAVPPLLARSIALHLRQDGRLLP